jgi:hypothetical protein
MSVSAGYIGADSENYLFGKLKKDYKDDIPNLIFVRVGSPGEDPAQAIQGNQLTRSPRRVLSERPYENPKLTYIIYYILSLRAIAWQSQRTSKELCLCNPYGEIATLSLAMTCLLIVVLKNIIDNLFQSTFFRTRQSFSFYCLLRHGSMFMLSPILLKITH